MKIFRYWLFRIFLDRYQWYRRWYGGRWECHWIEMTGSFIWHEMSPDPRRQWPQSRPLESRGTPLVEDYPYKGGNLQQVKP